MPSPSGQHSAGLIEFYDRSPVCTLALARYVGYQPSTALSAEPACSGRSAPSPHSDLSRRYRRLLKQNGIA